ncbi:hypothetical protein Ga0080559_TMP3573 [Salipiger profundus]|uniref:Uncharacterized protein n=1 Tax=Salipiger profundus TaxID=1229727 RepID=A0A1U7D8A8_9RHOB|nr:hypothetical protein Ga0080559_TMP3573 [Salipiger profundus]
MSCQPPGAQEWCRHDWPSSVASGSRWSGGGPRRPTGPTQLQSWSE